MTPDEEIANYITGIGCLIACVVVVLAGCVIYTAISIFQHIH